MRFLCLHGMGTNSAILEAQLAPICARMDPHHEFVFVDGLFDSEPADNVEHVFPGPFYSYYTKPVPEQLDAAYELIYEVIEDEGPFDGVIGFSQGAALAASLILHHQKTAPHAPDLFKVAIFACASLPFDRASEDRPDRYHTSICPRTGAVTAGDWIPGDNVEKNKLNGFLDAPLLYEPVLRRYHPARETTRIFIPTVHILGSRDPFCPQSKALVGLCGDDIETVVHSSGHQLPRDEIFSRKAAMAIENSISRALFKC